MSSYRVATAYSYDTSITKLQQRQFQLADTQDQLSSGKRVRRISDDPVAAALSEREQSRLKRIEADQRTLEASRRSLQLADSTLGSITDLYHRIKELLVQGGNGSLSRDDRIIIAQELAGIKEQLLQLSNSKDVSGSPLFMGLGTVGDGVVFQGRIMQALEAYHGADNFVVDWKGLRGQEPATATSLPFALDGYPIFLGASGLRASATAGATNVMSVEGQSAVLVTRGVSGDFGSYDISYDGVGYSVVKNFNGSSVILNSTEISLPSPTQLAFDGIVVTFETLPVAGDSFEIVAGDAADRSIWESLDISMAALMGDGATLTECLDRANNYLGERLNSLLSARAQVGDWLNRADQMKLAFEERTNYHTEQYANLTDLDMVEAISRFQTQQLGYEAGLQSYAQIQRQSLFQYLA